MRQVLVAGALGRPRGSVGEGDGRGARDGELSTTPEGVQGGVRHSVFQGIWWDRSLDIWMFLGTDFMISILTSSHI